MGGKSKFEMEGRALVQFECDEFRVPVRFMGRDFK